MPEKRATGAVSGGRHLTRAWLRLLVVAGLPLYVAAGLCAGLIQIAANHYVEQGFDGLALLLLRRVLNTSVVLFAIATIAALGAIRLATLLLSSRRIAPGAGASPACREAPVTGSGPERAAPDAGGAASRRALEGTPSNGATPGSRSAQALQAALALLVLASVLGAFLFLEFFPSLNAALRTSATVDAIQALLGPAGDFLGTGAGKILLLAAGVAMGSALLVAATVRILGKGRGAAALDRWLAGGVSPRASMIAAVAPLLVVVGVNAAALRLGPAEAAERPNIILISLETLRADHLEAWGYERPTAPSLTRLARRGVLFENAIAQAPWTLPSMATVHTGLYLSEHGAAGHKSKLAARHATLAEHLAEAGYRTMAVVSWPFVTRTHGFDQGFSLFDQDHIAEDGSEVLAPGVTRRAIEMIDSMDGTPFFLWLHYVEPHGAYVDHDSIDYASGYEGFLARVVDLEELYEVRERLREEDVRYIRDLYDEEITIMDESIGRLLDGLEERGLASGTILVVLGDHGEEFLERGHFGHARHLHQELIHVPLVIVDPRDPALAGLRVQAPVELRAVAPTILALAGVGDASRTHPGLLDLARGTASPGPAFSEYVDQWKIYGERKAVVEGRYKMIREVGGATTELYDLAADPGEGRNLAAPLEKVVGDAAPGHAVPPDAATVEAATRLARALDALTNAASLSGDEAILSEEEIERLRTLGYIH